MNYVNNIHLYDNITCNCKKSKYCHKDIGHVLTGDLSIIDDSSLRTLMTYGPKYRLPKTYNWKLVYNQVDIALNTCIKKWSKKPLHTGNKKC